MELSVAGWALAVLAAVAVGLAKGGLSMVSMIAVPILSLVMSPVQAAGILLPVYVVSDLFGLIVWRRDVRWRVLGLAMPGTLAGVGIGWALASRVSDAAVAGVVGGIGLVFALNALIRPPLGAQPGQAQAGPATIWGVVAGFTSFVSHAGAPPWQIYVQPLRLPVVAYAGTTTVYFALLNAAKLGPYAALGQLSAANLRMSVMLLLPAALSVWVGMRLVRIIPQAMFYRLITWALLIVSLRLVWVALA
ncbi:sulfite exporter TauE/SafE family protein [Paracoccus sp. p4-l81]|uniref:sulfite exporter TauE/SafE family protein n=1 Tax=unclassified Paracoccus (in: a-proteobacteria) TaxID=2688777 RepID=UPI0035B8F8FB